MKVNSAVAVMILVFGSTVGRAEVADSSANGFTVRITLMISATPDEVYFKRMPACRRPRLEPRSRWPRRSPCARPQVLVRGRPGSNAIEIAVECRGGRKHLPIVTLRHAA